ncbi:MAG: hypothetical protein AAFZ65_16715, partial [Planctomycetota bacterium]
TFVPGQSRELGDAIVALARDAADRRRLGSNGRSAFLELFEREVACEQWRELLEEIAGSGVEAARPAPARAA